MPRESRRPLTGTKEMGAKDGRSAFVCTNATNTLTLPMGIIGKSAKPRCFRAEEPEMLYFSQRNAWAYIFTF